MSEPTSIGVERAKRKNDNRHLTPLDILSIAETEIRDGTRPAKSLVILALDRGEDVEEYNVGWYAANIQASEIISLMKVVEHYMLQDMGVAE